MDFVLIANRISQNGTVEVYPKFIIKSPSKDLMIKGSDFYAVWVEDRQLWSTVEQDVIDQIDAALDKYAKDNSAKFEPRPVRVLHMWDAETGMADRWHKYCKQQMRDSFHMLDEKLIFANTVVKKEDYASKRLPYPLEEGTTEAWDKLIGTLYDPVEKHKIEWCIGAIVSGASKKLQKFMVLSGEPGTGKSTLLDILDKKLFVGYTDSVDSAALGSSSNSFALESFKSNPLVAIQHEGNLSRIEDNTRLNSLVSHDKMTVNEKYKTSYSNSFKSFLILSSNNPVKITDAKSGLMRRLIDVRPTGNLLDGPTYEKLNKQIDFELGAIAWKCLKIYEADPRYYNSYRPTRMLQATNDFYNFIMDGDTWLKFKKEDSVTLTEAWLLYNKYVEYAKIQYPMSYRPFKEELKNYFNEYYERITIDGTRVRSFYKGFKYDKFEKDEDDNPSTGIAQAEPVRGDQPMVDKTWIHMTEMHSLLDDVLAGYKAQYAPDEGKHMHYWRNVNTTLADLDTHKLHYVLVPEQMIVVDFDICDENGEKSLERNLEEASKWPATYAELSQSGKAIHLHYYYQGDKSLLSSVYDDKVEIKTLTGEQSLRRKLSLCNDIPIAKISSGLPLKEVKKTLDTKRLSSEKSLRELIKRNLAKEIHSGTKPSIDFIYKILEDAHASDLSYDISDMRNAITAFAAGSTHQAAYCLKVVGRMKFMSEDRVVSAVQRESNGERMVPFDLEIFPNLYLNCWKEMEDYSPDDFEGDTYAEKFHKYIERLKVDHKPVVKMFNPKPYEIEEFTKRRIFGFNNRDYDNHLLYGRMMGYSNIQCYTLSKRIVSGDRDAKFREASGLSETDVYDFASAGNKKSLKQLEIDMGFYHQELGLDWDEPVPEELWPKVATYCENDVLATEAAFWYLKADWTARQILADLAEMTVNDTTNQLTTRIIFDRVRNPQSEFQYRNLALPVRELAKDVLDFLKDADPEMMSHLHGDEESLLPYFPGYVKENGVSTYRGEEVGEGGYVYAEPGQHLNVALLDIASMHPHSIIAECLFGPRFTRRFKEIVDGRVDIKHEAWSECDKILDGKLGPYIEKVKRGEMTSKDLANALKTAINSVYGLTSAAFANAFRDPRNVDNIVAKRGALFMVNLKHEVQAKGFTVAHIKTDSIKIPNATPEIIKFVMDYGKDYGYTFEHEATYDRMCLVNNAVYIAKYATADRCQELYGYSPGDNKKKGGSWTATGKQFAVPYVFKTLFSREPIVFQDMCETFRVTGALYLDNNEGLPDVTEYEKELKKFLKENKCSWDEYNDYLRYTYTPDERAENPVAAMFEDKCRYLDEEIAKGHNYQFVGRVGLFTPVKPGCGGGLLLRKADNKYSSATGAQGFRWVESTSIGAERVVANGHPVFTMDDIDKSYYTKLCDEAKDAICQYVTDWDWFVGD